MTFYTSSRVESYVPSGIYFFLQLINTLCGVQVSFRNLACSSRESLLDKSPLSTTQVAITG